MPRPTLRVLLFMLAAPVLLAGCRDDGLSPSGRALEIAERRWKAQGLSHYTVETRILCFCAPQVTRWHEITVSSDSVIAARRVEPGDDEGGGPAPAAWFRSVEATFAFARRWPREQPGNRVEADFDPETGLPVRVALLAPPTVADGDAVYEFRALKPGLTLGARAAR